MATVVYCDRCGVPVPNAGYGAWYGDVTRQFCRACARDVRTFMDTRVPEQSSVVAMGNHPWWRRLIGAA